jgi:ferric-dicitrate binding protein FerR (iron transport regulator)/TolA-binding protein
MRGPPRPAHIASDDPDEQEVARFAALLPDPKPEDALVERVWRRMQNRETRRPSWVFGYATAVTALIVLSLVGVAFWLRPHGVLVDADRRAEVLLSQGGVFLSVPGPRWTPARSGDVVASGAALRSDASGQSVVRVPGVAALLLGRSADLGFDSVEPRTELRLTRGEVTARVIKRPAEHPFSLRSGDFTITVVGTVFSVRNDEGVVEVRVTEGAVAVDGRGGHWRVDAGHRWSSAAPDQMPAGQVPADRAALLLAASAVPTSAELPGLFAALPPSEEAPRRAISSTGPNAGTRPETTSEASNASARLKPAVIPIGGGVVSQTVQPQSQSQETRRAVPESDEAEPLTARLDTAPAVAAPVVVAPEGSESPSPAAVTPAPAPTPVSPPTPARDDVAEALELERHGDLRGAEESLKRALASPDARHDLALYQLAVLRQRRANDPQGALDALNRYRDLYPRGSLRQEVDLSIVEVDHTLGRTEATLAESAAFLSRYPQSERADEVRLLRGDILRQRGDCAKAIVEYRAVSGGQALDDALYYWAYCQRQLGASTAASEALRRYLVRFPAGRHADAAREALEP